MGRYAYSAATRIPVAAIGVKPYFSMASSTRKFARFGTSGEIWVVWRKRTQIYRWMPEGGDGGAHGTTTEPLSVEVRLAIHS